MFNVEAKDLEPVRHLPAEPKGNAVVLYIQLFFLRKKPLEIMFFSPQKSIAIVSIVWMLFFSHSNHWGVHQHFAERFLHRTLEVLFIQVITPTFRRWMNFLDFFGMVWIAGFTTTTTTTTKTNKCHQNPYTVSAKVWYKVAQSRQFPPFVGGGLWGSENSLMLIHPKNRQPGSQSGSRIQHVVFLRLNYIIELLNKVTIPVLATGGRYR